MKNLSQKVKHYLFISLGIICVGLAYIGIALPGVPGIPFVLLAIFFFTRSSPRLYKWMKRQKGLGKIVRKLETDKVNTITKWFVISQLWVSIIVAEIIFVETWLWGILISLAGLIFSYIIYRLF